MFRYRLILKDIHLEKHILAGRWCTPLIPALEKQRQVDLYNFEASLVYRVSSRTARMISQRNPVLKNKTKSPNSQTNQSNK